MFLYILELNHFYANLADSRDLYSDDPPLPGGQLLHSKEDGCGQEVTRRPDRASSLRQRGCKLCRERVAPSELAQVQGGEEKEKLGFFWSYISLNRSHHQGPVNQGSSDPASSDR